MQFAISTCQYCEALTPVVQMNDLAWSAISRCLSNGSPMLAAAELVSLELASEAAAKDWIEHLRNCVFSWPILPSARDAIDRIDDAFLGLAKPKHFTNFDHCSECKVHDDTLLSRTVKTIGRRDLGNLGWNPIGFSSPEGVAYYLPALARIALIPGLSEGQDAFVDMLAPKLSETFLWHCSQKQRDAVSALIECLSRNDLQQP